MCLFSLTAKQADKVSDTKIVAKRSWTIDKHKRCQCYEATHILVWMSVASRTLSGTFGWLRLWSWGIVQSGFQFGRAF